MGQGFKLSKKNKVLKIKIQIVLIIAKALLKLLNELQKTVPELQIKTGNDVRKVKIIFG